MNKFPKSESMQIVCIGRQNLPKKLRHSEHKPEGEEGRGLTGLPGMRGGVERDTPKREVQTTVCWAPHLPVVQ